MSEQLLIDALQKIAEEPGSAIQKAYIAQYTLDKCRCDCGYVGEGCNPKACHQRQWPGSAAQDQDKCLECGKTPETCWLPPHLCKHPARSPQDEDHEHKWVDARNRVVKSGEICLGCGIVRSSPNGK